MYGEFDCSGLDANVVGRVYQADAGRATAISYACCLPIFPVQYLTKTCEMYPGCRESASEQLAVD